MLMLFQLQIFHHHLHQNIIIKTHHRQIDQKLKKKKQAEEEQQLMSKFVRTFRKLSAGLMSLPNRNLNFKKCYKNSNFIASSGKYIHPLDAQIAKQN